MPANKRFVCFPAPFRSETRARASRTMNPSSGGVMYTQDVCRPFGTIFPPLESDGF
ncbi:MAG: hypothetical protein ACD_87C00028G0002 [uncultured bacterium]|nr:MAG: hypothetical protein ACD_87C00028G0002 [uncultured bacterium]